MNDKIDNVMFFTYAETEERHDLDELKNLVTQDLQQGNYKHAMPFAAQAAIFHGAVGLLLHHLARIEYLKTECGQNEIQATRCLKLLLACKKLYEDNPSEHKNVDQFFPKVSENPNLFWGNLTAELTQLGALPSKAEKEVEPFLKRYIID